VSIMEKQKLSASSPPSTFRSRHGHEEAPPKGIVKSATMTQVGLRLCNSIPVVTKMDRGHKKILEFVSVNGEMPDQGESENETTESAHEIPKSFRNRAEFRTYQFS